MALYCFTALCYKRGTVEKVGLCQKECGEKLGERKNQKLRKEVSRTLRSLFLTCNVVVSNNSHGRYAIIFLLLGDVLAALNQAATSPLVIAFIYLPLTKIVQELHALGIVFTHCILL